MNSGGFSNLILLAFKVPVAPPVAYYKATLVVLKRDTNSADRTDLSGSDAVLKS